MAIPTNESHDYLFKLLCIGEANVGKTTFLHQYIHDNFANFRSTVGIDILEKSITNKDNQRILLQLWDTAGQVKFIYLILKFEFCFFSSSRNVIVV
jgi:small GTP-binding protein